MKFKKVEKYTYVEDKHKPYLKELSEFVSKSEYLPKYHIYPKSGLMNDPNGLAYFNGEYNFFYQWFPFEPTHGMKHWGHLTSKDLLTWEEKDIALTPDMEYEKNGCYSGNSIEKGGLLYLFYTANYKTENDRIPKQAVAIMDKGGNIEKYINNPIIDGAPDNMTGDIRDPFVFRKGEKYYMLLGAKSKKEKGALLLYTSEDLLIWNYMGEINLPIDTGYMLECPSFIEVEGKDVIILSPMGLEKEELKYQNQFSTVYLVGKLDIENMKFDLEYMDEVDNGFDFYASQAFYGKDNKPMMVSWFGCGEQDLPTDKEMWKHGLTMPHTLRLVENRLCNFVSEELNDLFNDKNEFDSNIIKTKSNSYHIKFNMRKEDENKWVRFGNENDYWELNFDFDKNVIQVDRSNLKLKVDINNGLKRCAEGLNKEEYKVDIYVDNSFVEVFINEGMKSFVFRCFNLNNEEHNIQFTHANKGSINYYNK
ncbi:glycoside hydrolase family 32 protein [Romboutsia sp. 1001713B170207_170306_H8]|uniref:glycoside hydrolase family 32 protein n=1 Tax=Romboutsia sp. 1001713B170207_170306_H8 TaxID=2787112 RepID=UPI0008231226|nr:glycoside hydrolase family 32 protein [Romboutsia sp. 1001713B170207_170306_H8]SCH82941.1 Sucrose-6-phosphate hydrolase [uncultured Clostridium sp.]